jgi:hypothetical protein
VLALAGAANAHAYEVVVDTPQERTGMVWADVRLTGLFDARVEEGLRRGVPATLQIRVDLWRHRTAWFDRLERTFEGSIRIRYEVWRDKFILQRAGAEALTFDTLDSVRVALSKSIAIPITSISQLRAGPRYYLVVSCTLRPLSVEDVEELEDWLSGDVSSKGGSSFGFITAVPRALFDAVRNAAGFGDQRARTVSTDFDLATLLGTRTPLPERR